MCASYGLVNGPYLDQGESLGLDPLDSREDCATLDCWLGEQSGRAGITEKYTLNLNPVITAEHGRRRLRLGWWGIWRDGSGPAKPASFNSPDDSLLRNWRTEFQHRALLPATWYIEGQKWFSLPDGGPFAIAAITSTVIDDATGEEQFTYSMVTRRGVGEAASNSSVRGGPRMPLVLPAEMHDRWLDPERPGDRQLVTEVQRGSDEISLAMRADVEVETAPGLSD